MTRGYGAPSLTQGITGTGSRLRFMHADSLTAVQFTVWVNSCSAGK